MYIKEITIDGFKSYAQRVVIPGFDPQFNAITGLNGSGKSNILDSICFVLGIQNLQQVRGPVWGREALLRTTTWSYPCLWNSDGYHHVCQIISSRARWWLRVLLE